MTGSEVRTELTVPCEMVRYPFLAVHFLFCQTFLNLNTEDSVISQQSQTDSLLTKKKVNLNMQLHLNKLDTSVFQFKNPNNRKNVSKHQQKKQENYTFPFA